MYMYYDLWYVCMYVYIYIDIDIFVIDHQENVI